MSSRHPLFVAVEALTKPSSPYTCCERLVGLALAHHLDRDGECFPAQSRLAQWTGLNERSVRRSLDRLTAAGNLFAAMRGGSPKGGKRVTSRYRFSTPDRQTPDAQTPVRESGRPRTQSPPELQREQPKSAARLRRTRQSSRKGNGKATDSWSREACADWEARYQGTPPGGKLGKQLKPLVEKHGWSLVRPAWQGYLEATSARFASAARFASTFGEWRVSEAPPPKPEPTGPEFFGPRRVK